jgi:hypothetical protein
VEQRRELQRLELRFEQLAKPPRHVSILARVVARALDGHLIEGHHVLALSAQFLE